MSSYLIQIWRYIAVSLLLICFTSTILAEDEEGWIAKETTRVLLISSVVDDAGILADAAAEGVLVIHYDAETSSLGDLLSLVRKRLKGKKAMSIGILAHDYGSAKFYLTGEHTIGLGSTLNNEEQRQFWRRLGSMIAQGGRIDLFACRLASTPEGRMLVTKLSDLSGVMMSASTNETGNPAAGGDWVLETADVDAGTVYFDDDRLNAFSGLLSSEFKKLTALDAAAQDMFGFSVAVSGDIAIVGANWDDDSFSEAGSAYIFARDQGGADNWGQVKKLTASDPAFMRFFGCSVGISGDTAVVGSRSDLATSESGSAYIFSRNQGGANNWGEVKKITASDTAAGDRFGWSVAISGDYAIVGALFDSFGAGAAYIFSRNQGGINNWGEVKKLTASDAAAADYFSQAVAISGDYAIVGAGSNDDAGSDSGSAYIFARNQGGADNWGQVKKLTASDAAAGDRFGGSVAVSGDIAAVVAMYNDDVGSDSGSAYIFSRNHGGADNWGEITKLIASDAGASDNFGTSVAVSGDIAVIGAQNDEDAGFGSGSAYIFSRNFGGADSWGQADKFTASDAGVSDYFGNSVAVSGGVVVVGAANDDDAGSSSGSAYVFHIAVPALSSPTATGVSDSVATLGATVTSQGSSSIIERGVVWSISPDPTITNFDGKAATTGALGVFTVPATGLSQATTYYYRGYATNSIGTGYSPGGSFTTLSVFSPTLHSPTATDITLTSATLGATVASDGGLAITERGVVWSTSPGPTVSSFGGKATASGTLGTFTVSATGLSPATTYYYRGYATNFIGTGYSPEGTFTTPVIGLPALSNPTATGISLNGATLGATVDDEGDYPISERGVVWSTSPGPTVSVFSGKATASGTLGTFTVSATGLSPGTIYYYRGYATNAGGTGYSPEGTFTTLTTGSLQVTLMPPAAVAAGARWRIVGQTAWRNSGETVSGLVPGSVTVEFSPAQGYITPANISAQISSSQTTSFTVVYKEKSGTVSVTLLPMSARRGGAAWLARGYPKWLRNGASTELPVGTHTLEFKPVPGWIGLEVEVKVGQDDKINLVVEYLPFLVSDCSDYDGDCACNFALWRPSEQSWLVHELLEKRFGEAGVWPAPGDYDGDGKVELAYWHPGKGLWRIKGGRSIRGFGEVGDIPVPGDFDGDGLTDPALYRPSTGEWFIYESSMAPANIVHQVLGGGGEHIPVPGDYDGDGVIDPAVYSIKSGLWHVAFQTGVKGQRVFRISLPAPSNAGRQVLDAGGRLIPAPADYDGDGRTDIALVDLENGQWFVKDQFNLEIKCKAGDIPVPGDYDGDGAFEPALYRPKKGAWFLADGSKVKHGGKDDIPLVRGR